MMGLLSLLLIEGSRFILSCRPCVEPILQLVRRAWFNGGVTRFDLREDGRLRLLEIDDARRLSELWRPGNSG